MISFDVKHVVFNDCNVQLPEIFIPEAYKVTMKRYSPFPNIGLIFSQSL